MQWKTKYHSPCGSAFCPATRLLRLPRGLPGDAGAILIGDGRMALILNVDGLRSSDH
ncbi:hypothetical protein GGR61_000616 [Xanthomonas arboricola]|nr:hypothetical protein [Xanthomonas sp. 3075]MBB5863030.1 hypothetical protein [Xanthomonas sp. 3058]